MKTSIWVERYRPNTINDVIFQDDRQRKQFESFVANGDISHLLLTGVRGTGKTSISKSLMKDLNVHSMDILKINCSDEKIDAMRNKVTTFAMTLPIGKFKVVRLEEIDGLSFDAQKLLRGLIEDTSAQCRYIATCNYENRLIPELKDRFQRFYFQTPDKEKIAIRMTDILEKERVEFDIDYLLTYIEVGYPSIRQIIQLLQQNTINTQLASPLSAKAIESDWKFGLLDLISKGDFKKARKLVCDLSTREEHEEIFTFLYKNIHKLNVKDKETAIVTIAEYLYKHSICADTEINLAALFIELSRI